MSTYDLIAVVNVSTGGAANIQFTSIPATYTDLIIKLSARTGAAATTDTVAIYPNGSTLNMTARYVQGDQTSATSATGTAVYAVVNGSTSLANTFGTAEIRIQQYAAASNKAISVTSGTEGNAGVIIMRMSAGNFADATPITSITLTPTGGSFAQYTEASLYGVKNA